MAKGKKPKFKVGQVVRVAQGDYDRVFAIDTSLASGEHCYILLHDACARTEHELRPLTAREIGPPRKLKGER